MARYLARACPRCNGYVGIVVREPGRNTPLQAMNGHCLRCSYRMAWIVIRGKGLAKNSKLRNTGRAELSGKIFGGFSRKDATVVCSTAAKRNQIVIDPRRKPHKRVSVDR